MSAFVVLAAMLVLMALGMPVALAMMAAGSAGLLAIGGLPMMTGIVKSTVVSTVSSYELITIPMFLIMAELVLLSGAVDKLFSAAVAWVGRLRGGLAMAAALSGAGFAAICGTSTGSAATLASTTLPGMLRRGYDPALAAGVVAISGTLAVLIPPSVALIVYGLLADVSIGKLLIAGIIPGLLVTVTIIATVAVLVWHKPDLAPKHDRTSWAVKARALGGALPAMGLFAVITSCIYFGITTPTEASAIGAIAALLLAVLSGNGRPRQIWTAIARGTRTAIMLSFILIGAHVFGYYLTITRVPQELIAFVVGFEPSPTTVVILICLFLAILGMFMDQFAIMVLTLPVFVPMIESFGMDLVWFGILFMVVAEIGLVTPPLGLNCFIVAKSADRPLGEVFRGTAPHVAAHVILIALLIAFPVLVTWLPDRMG